MARLRRGDLLVVALAVVALAALAAFRPEPGASTDTYATTDFRSGGTAAWYELLQREGVPVDRFERRPGELDGSIGTLIDAFGVDPVTGDVRTPADEAALDAWVRAGGRLVVLGGGAKRPPVADARTSGVPYRGPLAAGITTLANAGAQRFVRRRGADVLLADRAGALVVRVRTGRGEVWYVTTPRPFANANLARGDNARLAFALARPPRAGTSIAFDEAIHGTIVDRTWWAVLPVPWRVALGGTAFAIVLALVGGALRLGPPVRLAAPRAPTSAEFLAAVAALYARAQARGAAIALLAGEAAAARAAPTDRDLIAAAVLARDLRKERNDGRYRDGRGAAVARGARTGRRRE